MALDKEFFENLDKLKNFKTKPELNDFFDVINKLEKIGEEINDEGHKKVSGASKLIEQAQGLTKKLEDNKDEIATRTKTQKEYDAVYDCIDYLGNHFNTLN